MAENWWDSTARSRFDSVPSSTSSSAVAALNGEVSFGWPTGIVEDEAKAGRSSTMDSSVPSDSTDRTRLQAMGLGLSSSSSSHHHHPPHVSLDWNHQAPLFRGDQKGGGGFRPMIQEDHVSSATNFQQETGMASTQDPWRLQKLYLGSSESSSANEFKQMNRGFSLDQYGESSAIATCQGLPTTFQMDSFGSPTILQGLFGPDDQQQQQLGFENRSLNYSSYAGYGLSAELPSSNWSKFPQFLSNSPPKQPPSSQLHFSNNAPFWNASVGATNEVQSNLFPSLKMQIPSSTFEERPKNTSEVAKKSGSEPSSTKRPRNESTSTLPAFKARKEKMGDRITALQQLVSPFGKTDTASVLSEAIEYIRFLHQQVNQVLSTPYMKNGASVMQHHQNFDKPAEGPRPDLRSRGLCLVSVSSTYPVAQETAVDFWTPTFGGTFR